MNRYPLWKNLLICLVLATGLLYTLPNFYGEVPAVQVSAARSTVQVDSALETRVGDVLKSAGIPFDGMLRDQGSLRVRVADTDTQLKAKDVIERELNPKANEASYVTALNLLSASPQWLTSLHALPMYLGLDLRGGVHFLLEVDMKGALQKQIDAMASEVRTALREKDIRQSGISRDGDTLVLRFRDADARSKARNLINDTRSGELQFAERQDGEDFILTANLTVVAQRNIQTEAIRQNIVTLHKRINELGVAEPVIQQQGVNRIVVQLPGVQDVARAKDIVGRTATLQVRLVDEAADPSAPPINVDVFPEQQGSSTVPVAVKKQVVLTGDRFVGAQASIDSQTQQSIVSVRLDGPGGRVMRDTTRENLKKRMAIILFEKGRGEAISVATIQGEFSNQFQISGQFTSEDANRLALLIRAGSLAAPMEIIEERTIGPSLGKDNIEKGFKSTMWGFIAIAVFMIVYYQLFGVVSALALAANLLLLIALLSMLQATLTLPGIAAIALTLGMAIDSNVLINERIREELRAGATPQAAINAGYDRAFDTILDSNITTLIAGIALLIFGSGPVRGFAVVHCLGILTSMFSAVLVSRMLTNFIYGNRRKLDKLSIGTIWKPGNA